MAWKRHDGPGHAGVRFTRKVDLDRVASTTSALNEPIGLEGREHMFEELTTNFFALYTSPLGAKLTSLEPRRVSRAELAELTNLGGGLRRHRRVDRQQDPNPRFHLVDRRRHRCWAAQQTLTDPAHVQAAAHTHDHYSPPRIRCAVVTLVSPFQGSNALHQACLTALPSPAGEILGSRKFESDQILSHTA